MADSTVPLTVFTKPWKQKTIPELGQFASGLGVDGIELPVRPGFQVDPENVEKGLADAAKQLVDSGIKIYNIAAPTNERTIAACGQAGVPIIRVCVGIDMSKGYVATIDQLRRSYEARRRAFQKQVFGEHAPGAERSRFRLRQHAERLFMSRNGKPFRSKSRQVDHNANCRPGGEMR